MASLYPDSIRSAPGPPRTWLRWFRGAWGIMVREDRAVRDFRGRLVDVRYLDAPRVEELNTDPVRADEEELWQP